jgi:hypothetical protein
MTKDLQVPAQVQALGRLLKASLNCPQVISNISYKTRFLCATFLSQAHDYLDLLQHHLGKIWSLVGRTVKARRCCCRSAATTLTWLTSGCVLRLIQPPDFPKLSRWVDWSLQMPKTFAV